MTYPKATIRVAPSDRLFDTLNTLLIFLSAMATAINIRLGFRVDQWKPEEQHIGLATSQFRDREVLLPFVGALEFALEGKLPTYIEFRIDERTQPTLKPGMAKKEVPNSTIAKIVLQFLIPHFVELYEN